MTILFVITGVIGAVWSFNLLIRRLDRCLMGWNWILSPPKQMDIPFHSRIVTASALSFQFLLDLAFTVAAAMALASMMGKIMGGPCGLVLGIAISYRIERWFASSSMFKGVRDAEKAVKCARLGADSSAEGNKGTNQGEDLLQRWQAVS